MRVLRNRHGLAPMARFRRASVWPRSRFSARGPGWPAYLRRVWEMDVRDLTIAPTSQPASSRALTEINPAQRLLVISATQRPAEHQRQKARRITPLPLLCYTHCADFVKFSAPFGG